MHGWLKRVVQKHPRRFAFFWVRRDPVPPPKDLKEQVVLVFTLKEFKSVLQFCSQGSDATLPVSINFFWGGKPMVVKTTGENFSAQLIMATLDHKMMAVMKTSSINGPLSASKRQ